LLLRIRRDLLHEQRAEYGEQIVATLSQQLTWSHGVELLPLKDSRQRDFYAEMCRLENWSVRTLRAKIDGMLFERTGLSRKPAELAAQELQALRDEDRLTPDLVFRDPYVLDFLGLHDSYSERELEAAILREIESFLLELGNGFVWADVEAGRPTVDSVALGRWGVESHDWKTFQSTFKGPPGGTAYGIPLSCLRSVDTPNLFAAGRTADGDEQAGASLRVMGTAFATGQPAGVAAAHLVQSAGKLDAAEVRTSLRSQGAAIGIEDLR
jgi:predicted nuclease of restriction endonuclease-like (RecB) superfamily